MLYHFDYKVGKGRYFEVDVYIINEEDCYYVLVGGGIAQLVSRLPLMLVGA